MNGSAYSLTSKDEWRQTQTLAILYNNAKGALFGSLFNILLVTYVLIDVYPNMSIVMWATTGIGINLVRWYFQSSYTENPSRFANEIWLQLHRVMTFASGSLYGALAFFFFDPSQPIYNAMVIFLVGGMGAAAIGVHSADLFTYRSFLFCSVLPLTIQSFLAGTTVHTTVSIMLTSMIIIMLKTSKEANKTMLENIDMSLALRYRATHDGLVGLLNRDEFQNLFELEQKNPSLCTETTSLIFIDLDNFKTLNDEFGHQAGDEALIKIGEIIRAAIRKEDLAARFGGDEFMLLIRSDGVEAAQAVAEKIVAKIVEFQDTIGSLSVKLGASIGIGYTHQFELPYDELLSIADKACYEAKHKGKGKIVCKKAPD